MTEREHRPQRPAFAEAFDLTEREVLFNHLTDTRLQSLLDQPDLLIHSAEVDSNSYGEFLFLTLSKAYQGKRFTLTCYSLGWHEEREEWIQGSWAFYQNNPLEALAQKTLSKAEVQTLLKGRQAEVTAWSQAVTPPLRRALLFRLLADLTDEDGAHSELEDLGDGLDWLHDEPE
jgi:hypothetical protein